MGFPRSRATEVPEKLQSGNKLHQEPSTVNFSVDDMSVNVPILPNDPSRGGGGVAGQKRFFASKKSALTLGLTPITTNSCSSRSQLSDVFQLSG